MHEFYQGLIAGVGILAGMCAFNYWVFNLMEKRIEDKIDKIGNDVGSVVAEMKQERLDKSNLYNYVVSNIKPK